jgi:hypothetical protein
MVIQIKKLIQYLFLKLGFILKKPADCENLELFISNFRNSYVSVDLVRIGGNGDGGYLVPNILNKIKYCYSPGVDTTANFESELSKKFSIVSFMADASVSGPPFLDKNFIFIKKFLGSKTEDEFITLSDWLLETGCNEEKKILQMDIEGGEYDVLTYESSEALSKFSMMVIEFHGLQNIFDKDFLKMLNAIFEKIYKNFSICHVHPNNVSGIASYGGINIPRLIEVTFINKDLLEACQLKSEISLPHKLDMQNSENYKEITMPEIWWKK